MLSDFSELQSGDACSRSLREEWVRRRARWLLTLWGPELSPGLLREPLCCGRAIFCLISDPCTPSLSELPRFEYEGFNPVFAKVDQLCRASLLGTVAAALRFVRLRKAVKTAAHRRPQRLTAGRSVARSCARCVRAQRGRRLPGAGAVSALALPVARSGSG